MDSSFFFLHSYNKKHITQTLISIILFYVHFKLLFLLPMYYVNNGINLKYSYNLRI